MKEIGGFFEFELNHLSEYHVNAIKLNTGRNCLEYILRAKIYKKIYLPYFICDVVLEPIIKLGLEYEFYKIDCELKPLFYKKLNENEAFLYVNYFGVKDLVVKDLSRRYDNLIVDNTQAFFSKPIVDIDTFYSPRKFVGVADGGYLYTNKMIDEDFSKDESYDRMLHLLKRIDKGAQESYSLFKENSFKLANNPIYRMSNLTKSLLQNIDYSGIKKIRECNFRYLHKRLKDKNLLNLDVDSINGPMVYPFMIKDDSVRQKLIDNKIFVALYWPNVLKWCNKTEIEYNMARYILPLPIDQRYNNEDMNELLKILV